MADLCQRRGGPRQTVLVLMWLAIVSVPTSLFALMTGPILAAAVLVLFIATCDAMLVMVVPVTTVVIPNELRGLCMAVLFATGVLFDVGLAPVLVSMLSNAMGGRR